MDSQKGGETSWGDGNVLYVKCGGDGCWVYNLPDFLKMCVNQTSIKLVVRKHVLERHKTSNHSKEMN